MADNRLPRHVRSLDGGGFTVDGTLGLLIRSGEQLGNRVSAH